MCLSAKRRLTTCSRRRRRSAKWGHKLRAPFQGAGGLQKNSLQQLEGILKASDSEDESNDDLMGLDASAAGSECGEGASEKDGEQDDQEQEEQDADAEESDAEASEAEESDAESAEAAEEHHSADDAGDAEVAKEEDSEAGDGGSGEDEDEEGSAEEEQSEEEIRGEEKDDAQGDQKAAKELDGEPLSEAEPPKPICTVPLQPVQHALVKVTQETQSQAVALRDSTTNKKEWDVFSRKLKAGSNVPVELSEYAVNLSKKKELFNLWLDAGQDWTDTQVSLDRKLTQRNQSKRGWTAIQGKDLKKRYEDNPEKYKTVIASRRANGLFYEDADFPTDPDEPWLH